MAELNIGQLSLSELFDEEFDFSEELSTAGSEQKPEKKKSEKKPEKKKNTEKPVIVTLPCKVIGANFSEYFEGEGEAPVEDIMKRLIELGYSEINHKSYSVAVPVEKGSVVYVVQDTSSLNSLTEDELLIDLSDGKELLFAFGQEKVTLTKEDFKDAEDDDISLFMVKEKIYGFFPLYKGIPLSYDPDSNMVVFLFDKVKADVMDYPCRLRVFGEERDLEEGPERITKLLDEQMAEYKNSNITISLSKTGQEHTFIVFFSSYLGSKSSKSSTNSTKKVGKKQTKYALPCKFRVCYNDVMQTLTPDMFEGKEKVVQEEIVAYFQKTMGGLFNIEKKKDTVKLYKVTEVIDKEQVEIVNIMFEPGTRGGFVNPSWQIPDDDVERFARPHLNSAQVLEMMEVEEATVFNAVVDTEIFGWQYCDMFANRMAYYVSKWYDSQFLMAAGLKKKVPKRILEGVISYFKTQLPLEAICRVVYNHVTKEYYLHIPELVEATKVSVKALSYPPLLPSEHLVMEIHSHNKMPAFWSSVDDAAELDGMGIYGVIGHLDKKEPSMCFRATKEGCQKALEVSELFED